MKNFGLFMQNPLENGSGDAPEDALMDKANVDVYSESTLEAWEQCHFNLIFPKLYHLKAIVNMAERFFNPLMKKDKEINL